MTEGTAILEQIIEPEAGGFSPELAQYLLSLSLPHRIQNRCAELSEKAQSGTLAEDEQAELDEYLSANAILIILKSKARASLRRHGSAA
ncbi:MAG TPA: hypothetical protein VN541_05980 [Tepidisphaeraceae bacterium]|nr:hypothetical protein [Tepidisphaeraceae bacterium]